MNKRYKADYIKDDTNNGYSIIDTKKQEVISIDAAVGLLNERTETDESSSAPAGYILAADLIHCVPINWLDPLLTGKDKVLPDGREYESPDIENLLLAIRKRMEQKAGI